MRKLLNNWILQLVNPTAKEIAEHLLSTINCTKCPKKRTEAFEMFEKTFKSQLRAELRGHQSKAATIEDFVINEVFLNPIEKC